MAPRSTTPNQAPLMEFKHINDIEKAGQKGGVQLIRLGLGVAFVVGVMIYAMLRGGNGGSLYIVAAEIGRAHV